MRSENLSKNEVAQAKFWPLRKAEGAAGRELIDFVNSSPRITVRRRTKIPGDPARLSNFWERS